MKNYTNAYDYLMSKLVERQEEVGAQIISGRIPTLEEYRRLCGVIQGLDYAKETVKDLQKREESDEDE